MCRDLIARFAGASGRCSEFDSRYLARLVALGQRPEREADRARARRARGRRRSQVTSRARAGPPARAAPILFLSNWCTFRATAGSAWRIPGRRSSKSCRRARLWRRLGWDQRSCRRRGRVPLFLLASCFPAPRLSASGRKSTPATRRTSLATLSCCGCEGLWRRNDAGDFASNCGPRRAGLVARWLPA